MDAAHLRQLADREDAAALRALDAGDAAGAREYRLLATLHREVANGLDSRPQTGHDVGTMDVGADSRGLKIAKTKSGKRRPRAVQALYDAGLTPAAAAALCGTSRDVLKQAWSKAPQFREIRPEWEATLEKAGVPRSVWPRKG